MAEGIPRWAASLRAAEGYLELGMAQEAELELENIPAECRNFPEVLNIRIAASMAAAKWTLAASLSKHMLTMEPSIPGFWINCAYSVRRSESVDAAEAVLLAAVKLHPSVATIHYNLACYAAVTGRLPEAETRLSAAFEIDPEMRELARNDADLKPLWNVLGKTGL